MSANIRCIRKCCPGITCFDLIHNATDALVTASGAADGTCNDCEVANGSHTIPLQLTPPNDACLWTKIIETSCSPGPDTLIKWQYSVSFRREDDGAGHDDWFVRVNVFLFSFNSSTSFQVQLGIADWEGFWTSVPNDDPVDMSTLGTTVLTLVSAGGSAECDFPTAISVAAA